MPISKVWLALWRPCFLTLWESSCPSFPTTSYLFGVCLNAGTPLTQAGMWLISLFSVGARSGPRERLLEAQVCGAAALGWSCQLSYWFSPGSGGPSTPPAHLCLLLAGYLVILQQRGSGDPEIFLHSLCDSFLGLWGCHTTVGSRPPQR